jgi:hypothetical protein
VQSAAERRAPLQPRSSGLSRDEAFATYKRSAGGAMAAGALRGAQAAHRGALAAQRGAGMNRLSTELTRLQAVLADCIASHPVSDPPADAPGDHEDVKALQAELRGQRREYTALQDTYATARQAADATSSAVAAARRYLFARFDAWHRVEAALLCEVCLRTAQLALQPPIAHMRIS